MLYKWCAMSYMYYSCMASFNISSMYCTLNIIHPENISAKRHVLIFCIFYKSEMFSTHWFLRTENLSICHGVVRIGMFN